MEKYSEDLLLHLGMTDAERINWYKARHYVMKNMAQFEGKGIAPNSSKSLHVVLADFNPLMMATARQICLSAHYPNFNEETGCNRTRITVCAADANGAYEDMRRCAYLGNLLQYCCCSVNGTQVTQPLYTLPLDVEFEFVSSNPYSGSDAVIISTADVEKAAVGFKQKIDCTMGMLVNMVYCTGAAINNLPATDNGNIERYSTALKVFCYKIKHEKIKEIWDEISDVRLQLSSVFCADCFESHIRGLVDTSSKSVTDYVLKDFKTVLKQINDTTTLNAFAKCEHSRWNVEKLIMGFKPLSISDWYNLENCFGNERKAKIKALKQMDRHIDLCSNRDLRRVDPGNLKYDYFLMLAMPQIMRRYLL